LVHDHSTNGDTVSILSPFRPLFQAQTYRVLLFLVAAIPIGAVMLGLLIAGWTSVSVLAITPLVVPLLLGFRGALGLLARADSGLARGLLGVESDPPISSGGQGYWGRGKAVVVDARFWKQQAYLTLRMTVGFAIAVGEIALIAGAIGWIGYPIWYRWDDLHFGSWEVDTLGRAFLLVPAGIVGLGIALALLRPLAVFSEWLVRAFLAERPPEAAVPHRTKQARRRALAIHAGAAGVLGGIQIAIWAFTTSGYFWPEWVLLPLGLSVAVHAWIELVATEPRVLRKSGLTRALLIHAGASAALVSFLTLVWAVTSRGYFWPEWVLLSLGLIVATHAWVELAARPGALLRRKGLSRALVIHAGAWGAVFFFEVFSWVFSNRGYFWPMWILPGAAIALGIHAAVDRTGGQRRLLHRVKALETTRAGAVEEQDAELRRIERDLHDGAQARLVALGMSLGMAEQKFRTDPEAAQLLVAEARAGVAEALRELRDLARGVYPPVLSDRGLGAALMSLADRSPLPTTVEVSLDERPAAQVEAAAYFVAAEALANAAKHSGAHRIAIGVAREGDALVIDITDDGRGGADSSGSGLIGLRRRVEALDGALSVTSPPGGPTRVRAELPCAS
jgi:signal transduction histidine kinase